MILTQVRVVHSETISPQQYESKKHEVELVFNSLEGESLKMEDVDQASQRAMDAVRDFIGRPRKQIAKEVAPWKEPLELQKGQTVKEPERPEGAPPPKDGPIPFNDDLPPALEPDPEKAKAKTWVQPSLPASKWDEGDLISYSEWLLEAFELATSTRDLKIILERNLETLGVLKEKRPNENDRVTAAYRKSQKKLKTKEQKEKDGEE